jgi:hypothetical protein
MANFNLPFGVYIAGDFALDASRYFVPDISARDYITIEGRTYEGLQTFVDSEKKVYIYKNSIWEAFGSGDVSLGYVNSYFIRSSSTGVGLVWNAGMLDVSVVGVGASAFINLTDCPSSYEAGKMIVVNDACTGIEYAPRIWRESLNEVTLDDPSSNILIYDYIELESDAGLATVIDKDITSSAGTTEQGYKFNLDGSTLLKVYGVADGSGGLNSDKGISSLNYFYIGDPAVPAPYPCWRIYMNTDASADLIVEKRNSGGNWVESQRFI